MQTKLLIKRFGQPYSSLLKIDLGSRREKEIFKWFLASILFGKPIREEAAMNTFKLFIQRRVDSPNKIVSAGWNKLVRILDSGGYVRYDYSTATKLLKIMKELNKRYHGKVTNIYKQSKDTADLERRLREFKGIGPVTINIFLRELRNIWKIDPEPCEFASLAAKKLRINLRGHRKRHYFVNLECALLRLGKNYIRKNKPLPILLSLI